MIKAIVLFSFFLATSCQSCRKTHDESSNKSRQGVSIDSSNRTKEINTKFSLSQIINHHRSQETLKVNKPSIIIVVLDSTELEIIKKIDGEGNFYTASDDLMWYNSMVLEKMDSMNIPVMYSEADSIIVDFARKRTVISKDTTFTLYTNSVLND